MSDTVLAILFIGGFVLYGAIGTTVVRRLIRRQVAEGHNDVLVPLFLTAGVIYAVLLGFMVVGEWESYDAARANAGEEAAVLVPLYRQTTVMDAHGRDAMRKVLREYAEHVVQGWQRFANGERNRRAGHDANEILSVIGELKFENEVAGADSGTVSADLFAARSRPQQTLRAGGGLAVLADVVRRHRRRHRHGHDEFHAVYGALLAASFGGVRHVCPDRHAVMDGGTAQPAVSWPTGTRSGAIRAVAFRIQRR